MDPYKVLGVSRNTSDDDIKKAYRDLARKYHPDNYSNNPLADLAQEKMKEINDAYDRITKEREGGGSGGYDSSYAGYTGNAGAGYGGSAGAGYGGSAGTGYGGTGAYTSIRQMIAAGNLDGAEAALRSMNAQTAEWYFLMGSVAVRRGWYDEARQNLETAVQMEPGNPEYRAALNQLNQHRNYYRSGGNMGGGTSTCDCCSSLICADCLCECLGGDLIPCC